MQTLRKLMEFDAMFYYVLLVIFVFIFKMILNQLQNGIKNCMKIIQKRGDITISVVTNEVECNKAVDRLLVDLNGKFALGFDCEWISQPKGCYPVIQPISLLQLCSMNGFCCLIRLNKLQYIPQSLQLLLQSEVVKLGVNCGTDAKLIEQNYGIRVNNFLDIRHLYGLQTSLASLSQSVIGFDLCKDLSVICSDWDKEVLNDKQIEYAARDAWAAIEIFKAWSAERSAEVIKSCIQTYQNVPFKVRKDAKQKTQEVQRQNSIPPLLKEKFARKSPLYDNCWMFAPDGEVLCSCDRRKAVWYVERGLAKVTSQDPFSIRLFFEPNSRPGNNADGNYYRQFKKNCCVVCGSEGPCMRYHVMPKEYRKHFPKHMKSHQSHDVVLTCLNCHVKSELYMRHLKEDLAQLCGAPTYKAESVNFKQFKKMKNICRTLLNSGENIPKEKKQCLEESVKEFFGLMDVNSDILKEISSLTMVEDSKHVSHGEKVVEHFKNQSGGLSELEVLWRKQFLQNLKPQFLPTAWSVTHNHKKLM